MRSDDRRAGVGIVVRRAAAGDAKSFRALARDVEALFGAPMADDPEWNAHLDRHLARGTAWVATDPGGAVLGGMWLSQPEPAVLHLRWLAVFANARGRGAGRALVEQAIAAAGVRFVDVVTFGAGHPGGAEAEVARGLYRALGFVEEDTNTDAPDGTPRERLVRPLEIHGDGITLRPLVAADAVAHKAGEDDEQRRGFEFPGPAPIERVEVAIDEWRASWAQGGAVRNFGVWDRASGALVGNVEVRALGDATVNLSYLVFPEWRRRGIATGAARLALDYARDLMQARAAWIEVLVDNVASLGVVRRLGGARIGEERRPTGSMYAVFVVAL